jgi:hypothetical protein
MHDNWGSFFTAQVGASAALTGLVFVALSINLGRIMKYSQLVERAGEAVVLLVQPVIVGLAVLAPYRSHRTTGVLVAIAAVACWTLVNRMLIRGRSPSDDVSKAQFVGRIALAELALLPAIIGAIALIADSTSGFGFIAVGAVLCIAVGILDAWILLVEILR